MDEATTTLLSGAPSPSSRGVLLVAGKMHFLARFLEPGRNFITIFSRIPLKQLVTGN